MFVYALAKGVRNGYLPATYLPVAKRGYKGWSIGSSRLMQMVRRISTAPSLLPVLGGNPYRDGSYQYYLSEKVVTNDPKGVGSFLMASNEMDIAAKQPIDQGKTVMLDSYFNNEMKKDASGQMVSVALQVGRIAEQWAFHFGETCSEVTV
jgi:unsaturated rhamnogalacturonyl hydrolase